MSTVEVTNSTLHAIDRKYYLPTFKRYPIAINKASGSYVWDVNGKRYLDLIAGLAVNNLGHTHPEVVDAITRQASRLMHISNFYVSEPQMRLAQRLAELSGLERVFLVNSGAEAVEGAVKIARKYAHRHERGGEVISMQHCFHGRTLGTIAMAGKHFQRGFEPIPGGFKQVPMNDFAALQNAVSQDTGAIIIEPVQGEGGIHPCQAQYLHDVRRLCDETGICLIFDEIQCGMARTGALFAKDLYDVQPDIMTLAKALGNGMPIGAILSRENVSAAIEFGDHGTTFGGNPMACAAALATLHVIERDNLAVEAERKGRLLFDLFGADFSRHASVKEIRWKGLMFGIELDFDARPVVMQLLENGILANATGKNVLRLLPPLTITDEQLVQAVGQIRICIEQQAVKEEEGRS